MPCVRLLGICVLLPFLLPQPTLADQPPTPVADVTTAADPARPSPNIEIAVDQPDAGTGIDRSKLAVFDEQSLAEARVLSAINDRLALMRSVAAVKWMSGAPISDPARETEVLAQVATRAMELGLDVPAARVLFTEQMRLSRELQQRLHDDWRRAGRCAPCETPVGLLGLRESIDTINEGLLLALYLAAPLAATGPSAEAVARTADTLWTEHVPGAADRTVLLAAVSAVRRTGAATWDRVKASGILRIGTTGDYTPFSLESDGKLRGADIELAIDLAARLQLYPVFVRTSWPTLLQDLRHDRYDVALSGISFAPERAAVARFSDPYHQGGKTILARCAQREEYETLAEVDRPGVRVIVNPGGTNERYVRDSLHQASILVHPDNRTAFDEIVAGRADVMITDDVEVELQTRRHSELCRTLPGILAQGDKRILMANDERLHTIVNSWLSLASLAGIPQRYLEQAMAAYTQGPQQPR